MLSIPLSHRAILTLTGEDRRSFLQGLVSNDVNKAATDTAIYAAMLTPQGKFLHDMFVMEADDVLLLECEAERREDLRKRLSIYRLRAKVALATEDGLAVYALIGEGAAAAVGLPQQAGAAKLWGGGVVCVDPRLAEAGLRAFLPAAGAAAALATAGFAAGTIEDYDRLRIGLGLPDGSRDMAVDKAILLENGFDELHGVDWQKGCYMGQELTARTKYRGLIKKRLLPVEIDGPPPAPGTPIMLGDKEAGEMRSSAGNVGLALLRLEILDTLGEGTGLTAGTAGLRPRRPAWVNLAA